MVSVKRCVSSLKILHNPAPHTHLCILKPNWRTDLQNLCIQGVLDEFQLRGVVRPGAIPHPDDVRSIALCDRLPVLALVLVAPSHETGLELSSQVVPLRPTASTQHCNPNTRASCLRHYPSLVTPPAADILRLYGTFQKEAKSVQKACIVRMHCGTVETRWILD